MSEEKKGTMLTATGLWKSKSGTSLSGTWGNVRVVVFQNKRKTADNQPDYYLSFAEKEQRTEAQSSYKSGPKNYAPAPPKPRDVDSSDFGF